jgi:hypothetical protein
MPARERHPGGEKAQESYVPVFGLNRRARVADSRVEQSPEGGGSFRGPFRMAVQVRRLRRARSVGVVFGVV